MLFYLHNPTPEQKEFMGQLEEVFEEFYTKHSPRFSWSTRRDYLFEIKKTVEKDTPSLQEFLNPTADAELNKKYFVRIFSIFLKQFDTTEKTKLFTGLEDEDIDNYKNNHFLLKMLTTSYRTHKRLTLVFQLVNHMSENDRSQFDPQKDITGGIKNTLKLANGGILSESTLTGITQATRNDEIRRKLTGRTPEEIQNILTRLSTVKIRNTKTMTSVNEVLKYSMENTGNSISINSENFKGYEKLIREYPRQFLASSLICSLPSETLLKELTQDSKKFYRLLDTIETQNLYLGFHIHEIGASLGYIFDNSEDHSQAFKIINKILSYNKVLSFSEVITLTTHFDTCEHMPYSWLEALGN